MTSPAFTDISNSSRDDHEVKAYAFDCIEAEIDQLKEDVLRLREEADHGQPTNSNNGKPLARSPAATHDSAAARLQRMHEAGKAETQATSHPSRPQHLPTQMDFPALGTSHTRPSAIPMPAGEYNSRPTSYADAATTGMMDAIDRAFSTRTAKRKDTKLSDGAFPPLSNATLQSQTAASSTAGTHDTPESQDDEHCSIIVSREQMDGELSACCSTVNTTTAAHLNTGKTLRQAPRFAQPTRSSSQRVQDTLRKEVSPVSVASASSGTPARSTKGKDLNFATDKKATLRQQKRKSLPFDWMANVTAHHSGPISEPTIVPPSIGTPMSDRFSSPVHATLSKTVESWQFDRSPQAKDSTEPLHAMASEVQGQHTLRKKASSYMAPTAAATQRTIAMLGQEKTKRDVVRTKAMVTQTSPVREVQQIVTPTRSCTISSDQSSVQFILEHHPSDATTPDKSNGVAEVQNRKPANKSFTASSPTRASSRAPSMRSASVSPSKIPRRTSRVPQVSQQQTETQEKPPLPSKRSPMKMAEVSNVVPMRRTSRGHILQPIIACLDAKGLLSKTTSENAAVRALFGSDASKTGEVDSGRCGGRRSTQASSTMEMVSPQVGEARNHTSPSKTSGSVDIVQGGVMDRTSGSAQVDDRSEVLNGSGDDIFDGHHMPGDFPSASGVYSTSGYDAQMQQRRTSSLRATANEFTPTSVDRAFSGQFNMPSTLAYLPPDEWFALSPDQRQAIVELRTQTKYGSMHSANFLSSNIPMRGPIDPAWTTSSIPQTALPPPTFPELVDENGSPNGVQAGQVLRPTLSPGKKTVQWVLQDLDGKQTPLKFGRAPPPSLPPLAAYSSSTPSLSPTSDDTAPLPTPGSLPRRWHIDSAVSHRATAPRFGWEGGDGKEIRFVGYGPHAERDSPPGAGAVVHFNFGGVTASYDHVGVPNGFHCQYEDPENFHSDEVAPRSRLQWALKAGYERLPCGDVEVGCAVEHCVARGGGGGVHGSCGTCVGEQH